jgi:phosphoacetylglucosamine mutase
MPDSTTANIIVGRDTRASSAALATAVLNGVAAAGGSVQDVGVVTTPQLHYMVVATNTKVICSSHT